MQIRNFSTTVVLLLLAIITHAQQRQDATLTGRILNSAKLPVQDAAITLNGTNTGTYTNSAGYFRLEHIKPGKYILLVKMLGYTPSEKEIVLKAGAEVSVDLSLAEESVTKEGITVSTKTHSRELKESGFAVNAIDTKAFANTTADMNSILNKTTGVKVREQGGMGSDFNFSINGLSGKAVRFFIDGVPMEVLGSSMTLNNIPVNLAERIEVYKGVLPVYLGADALGGAVNLVTDQQVKNYLDASYSIGSFNTHRAAVTAQMTSKKLGIITRLRGFYNYSDNNYIMRDIELWDENKQAYIRKDVRRFHDRYKAAMVQGEIGVMNKKWADIFFIGVGYSATDKQIQTGTNQETVYGAAKQKGDAFSATLRYKKKDLFTKGMELNVFASHTEDKYVVTDTTGYRYFWDGSRQMNNQAELSTLKVLTNISRPRSYARVNLSYELSPVHSFNLNYTFDHIQNKNYNELIADKDYNPGKIGKHILGFAYQQNLLEGRWTNTLFGKYYGMKLDQPVTLAGSGVVTTASDFNSYYGYGLASRFKITPSLGIKISYENAYRLQEVTEVFGNGYDQISNPNLKPENSHNFNAGAYYGIKKADHRFFAEASYFLRDASDFIYSVVYRSNSKVSRYENTSKVKINGVEADVQYDYSDLLHVQLNSSYQNAINNTKYSPGVTSGTPEATYKNKIPNQPWLYGNALIGIGKNDLLGKQTRLQLNWDLQYIHWFYLTWEAYGSDLSKNRVPDQYIQNASLSYSLQNGKYNISAECRNLANALAYDNYLLQKPGRSFAVKFRYFFK
jgi:outer membrane receptor protein involved in Fe transport